MRANNEGTVYQRGDGRWVASVTQLRDGKRKRVSRYADSEDAARKKLTELTHKKDIHEPIHFGRETVGAWLETWLDVFIRPHRKPRTWASYHQTIHTYVLPAIGREKLSDFAPELIQAVLNYHVERGRKRTASYIRTILCSAFGRAKKLEHIARNPVDGLETISVDAKETEVFTAAQAEAFFAAAQDHRLEGLFWLALSMGFRKGELCGLSLADVDFENATIHIRETVQRAKLPGEKHSRVLIGTPKSRASQRKLPLPDCAMEAFRRHAARRENERLLAGSAWRESGRIFTSSIGTILDLDKLTKIFHDLCERAKVPKIRFHDLRHSCGTFLHAQGVSPFVIAEILGHSQLVTTRRYTHVDVPLQKSALEKVGNLLQKTATDAPVDSSFHTRSAVKAAVKTRLYRVK
jgi:integrase